MHPWQRREAARQIRSGRLIAYPTEAVYGLGCDPLNPYAIAQLLALKQRPMAKGLILIAAHFDQLKPFLKALPEPILARVFAAWPGPTTWLLPAADGVPEWIRGRHETLAVRVTAHPIAADLCRACGSALISTSANPGNHPPAKSPLAVRQYFGDEVPCIIHGALGQQERPTQICDARTGAIVRG